MSDALIGCQPRTEDPSNWIPSSNSASSRRATGNVVCCHTPGKSMNLRSTNLTSFFCANSMASFGFMASFPSLPHVASSDRFLAALAGPDSNRFFDRADKDLSVADPSGLRALLDRVEDV